MKHRRGIDLGRAAADRITYLGPLMDPDRATFADIPEWHTLGGHCSKCEREAWLVRWDVARKWGNNTFLGSLTSRMRCIGCGNRNGNKWIIGQLPR